ncbi:MAG: radical SAM protein [Acidobacteria bacterium]|nr:radical SAM protein [Acidobacteriota bacterium]
MDGPPTYRVYWRINEECNFNCSYCDRRGLVRNRATRPPGSGGYDPEKIAACFDATGHRWQIVLRGGEPFLYKNFVPLAQALTRRHIITVSTNLSTSTVVDFARTVSPDRVHAVYANLHPLEREKLPGSVPEFLGRIHLLQDTGFKVTLVYVAYPPLIPRMMQDKEHFEAQGVRRFSIRTFRGRYEGRLYPESLTEADRRKIRKHAESKYEPDTVDGRLQSWGRICLSGFRAFRMDPNGNLTRCNTVTRSYGNLFDGSAHFDTRPRPCPARRCGCPYQGLRFATNELAGGLSTLKELCSSKLDSWRRERNARASRNGTEG